MVRRTLIAIDWFVRHQPSGLLGRVVLARGVRGSSRVWWWIGVAMWVGSVVRRIVGRHPESLGTEVLHRGQFVTVRSIGALSKAERKQVRKATGSR
jgi:hypothetical protein